MYNMPKYVLKQKRLSKTKTVVIFRRNNLDINNFTKTDNGWLFEENFVHYGTKCYFKMIIHSANIFSMYMVDTKEMKIKGKSDCFGVFIRLPKQNTPFENKKVIGCVEYFLQCSGAKLAYDNGKGIGNKKTKKYPRVALPQYGSKTPIEIPASVRWNASHPFQGGGVSPR